MKEFGLEIDKTPKVLKDKIVAFVEEIEHASKKVTLNLHPKDAELIEDISIETKLDENIELKKTQNYFRRFYHSDGNNRNGKPYFETVIC